MDQMSLRDTFNEDAANYDRWRPRYVPELFQAVFRYAGEPGLALEMGLGTGQATEPFLNAGWQVTGVELGKDLAAFAGRKFQGNPGLRLIQGDFLTCPLEGPFDLFYSATAFHWLPQERAFPLVKKLLRPGGVVALFWNHPWPEEGDPARREVIQSVYEKYQDQEVETYHGISRKARQEKEELLRSWGFGQVESHLFYGVRQFSPEGYVGLMNTYSGHRAMEEGPRLALEQDMKEAICKLGGVLYVYDTIELYLARKP